MTIKSLRIFELKKENSFLILTWPTMILLEIVASMLGLLNNYIKLCKFRGASMCSKCWRWIPIAVKVLDFLLRGIHEVCKRGMDQNFRTLWLQAPSLGVFWKTWYTLLGSWWGGTKVEQWRSYGSRRIFVANFGVVLDILLL